jgi:hypothetical protein
LFGNTKDAKLFKECLVEVPAFAVDLCQQLALPNDIRTFPFASSSSKESTASTFSASASLFGTANPETRTTPAGNFLEGEGATQTTTLGYSGVNAFTISPATASSLIPSGPARSSPSPRPVVH